MEFPLNNVLHDIILNFFCLLFEQEKEVIKEVVFAYCLLEKVGNLWVTRKNAINLISSSRAKRDKGIQNYEHCFGHVAILTNLLLSFSTSTKMYNELMERKEWKESIELSLECYNNTHPQPLFELTQSADSS
jgi:hypothetical protein